MISTMPAFNSKEFDYARLIAELNAVVGFNDTQLTEVAQSMTLELSDVQAIIDNAEHVFENAKANVFTGTQQSICYPFEIEDVMGAEGTTTGTITIEKREIILKFDGHSNYVSQDSEGAPIVIERNNSEINLILFGDINSEEPTDIILLSGARNEERSPESSDGTNGIIEAVYVSDWEEGRVETKCLVNIDTLSISNLEQKDCPFEHHESDFVQIVINGTHHQIEAKDGVLTEVGKKYLAKITFQ